MSQTGLAYLYDTQFVRRERAMFKSREKSIFSTSYTLHVNLSMNAGWLNKLLLTSRDDQLEESVTRLKI